MMHIIKAAGTELKTGALIYSAGLQLYRLELDGRFDPGWAGYLSNSLSGMKISIMRVEAKRISGRHWHALIDLDFTTSAVLPEMLDYAALCRSSTGAPPDSSEIILDDYQIERSACCSGSLYLEASGHDRIGLLSSLLNTFSLFSLFPAEMMVETKGKRIYDRFWLKGMGERYPSDEAVSALAELMQESVSIRKKRQSLFDTFSFSDNVIKNRSLVTHRTEACVPA